MNDPMIPLSTTGRLRRAEILELALREARQKRLRRRSISAFLACAVVALAVSLASHHLHNKQPPRQVVDNPRELRQPSKAPEPIPQPHAIMARIVTDPQIIDRLRIAPAAPRWKKIGDDELLRELAAAHRPAGLAYINGKPVLLFQDTQADLNRSN